MSGAFFVRHLCADLQISAKTASADALLPLYETGAVEEAKVIKDVARYAIITSPSFHSTSNPSASQRARTGA